MAAATSGNSNSAGTSPADKTGADSTITHVLLADDHAVVRSGIRLLLDAEPDLEVVGEAKDGLEAVSLTEKLQPPVVVMDISMPKLNGIAATRRIHNLFPAIGVIALTMHDNDAYFYEILRAGGSGYILKDAAAEDLVKGIRAAAAGKAYLSASVAGHVLTDYIQRSAKGETRDRLDGLTEREQEILALIADGLTNRQIAEQLVVSVKTVETHRTNLMQKLDLHDRTELVKYAIRKGLISLEPDQEVGTGAV
jgi:two-component system response regulator NreC